MREATFLASRVAAPRKEAWQDSFGGAELAKPQVKARLAGWPTQLLADRASLPAGDEAFLRRLARDTWQGIDAFTDREHGLPIDHVRFCGGSLDPHAAFQRFKLHPFVAGLLEGGQLVRFGAKALPEGGWNTQPRLYADGALIVGDAANFVNSLRLKGIHLAMRTGMHAADAAFDAVRANDVTAAGLAGYERAIAEGPVKRELYAVRNVHQAFEHGLLAGVAFAGLSMVTGGWWFSDPMPAKAGHARMHKLIDALSASAAEASRPAAVIDRKLTFDRTTGVHYSGAKHREDEPSHLIVHDLDICRTRCVVEYNNPCTRFCPAGVYEMVEDAAGRRLQINAANCVHCKTCDIKDPYEIITWVTPEGGSGPNYQNL